MSNFHEAKSCLKKVVQLFQENSQLGETEVDQRKLSTGTLHVHVMFKENHNSLAANSYKHTHRPRCYE